MADRRDRNSIIGDMRSSWRRFELPIGLSLFLLWAAFPPLSWWPLAWLFPLPWILVVRPEKLGIRRPYLRLWLLGGIYWIAVLQGIRLAHWANYLGLFALGLYFGACWPIFAGAARSLHHRLRLPLPVAVSLAWVGIEWLRGQGPVGFSAASLAHTQVDLLPVIQVADLAGGYLVSWLIVCCALSAAAACWEPSRLKRVAWITLAAVLLTLDLGYGMWRLIPRTTTYDRQRLKVALIQGSIDTEFNSDPGRPQRMMKQYGELTYQARKEHGRIDLVVWPESMFPVDAVSLESDAELLAGKYRREDLLASQENFQRLVRNLARGLNQTPGSDGSANHHTWFVLGVSAWHFDEDGSRRFNTAMLFDAEGNLQGRYDKMHPVLFGEYIPLGDVFPWLYKVTPMPDGLTPGQQPASFEVGGTKVAPSICFESTMPSLIRRQVLELTRRGHPPDVLLNITNDGWFWGSSILDLHLSSAVFRAIENRRPFLVAANTGISAWIDADGRVRTRGPKRDTAVLIAEPTTEDRVAPYHRLGDWPWIASLALSAVAIASVRLRRIAYSNEGEA